MRFRDADVTLVVDRDGHWNHQCAKRAFLTFHTDKNLDSVRAVLRANPEDVTVSFNDEIIGIVKLDKTTYLVEISIAQVRWSWTVEAFPLTRAAYEEPSSRQRLRLLFMNSLGRTRSLRRAGPGSLLRLDFSWYAND